MPRPAEPRGRPVLKACIALGVAACGAGGGAASDRDAPRSPVAEVSVGTPVLAPQRSGTSELLQAVSAVDDRVVWVSGHGGTWARTLDGGATWEPGIVPGADTLQFRDVHALSADVAWLLAAGPGELSRIYHTRDGGGTWTLQWTNPEPTGFYDCLDFWDDDTGVVYGDAVEGQLRILRTVDGGRTWSLRPGEVLPDAQLEEGGFAASGTCLVTGEDGRGWVATGNARRARVLHTEDRGLTWTAYDTPIPGGEAAGLFSVAFRDSLHGIVVGGSLREREDTPPTPPRVAVSRDGGASWQRAGQPVVPGALFGGAWVPNTEPAALVVVAPSGASWSADGGRTWLAMDSVAYWGLDFASPDAGWLVGPGGRITKVSFPTD